MSVVSVQAKSFILALFIRDDGERFLLGDNGYEFKDGQLHFSANDIENDEVAKQGADGVMLAGQVRRSSVQEFEGYVGDATDAKDTIEDKRKAFIAFFASGHHFRVVYVDCNSNAWQRKGGYLVDAPEVKELWQIHPEYHVGLNFEDVNYYSYNEDAEGDEILANYLNVPVSSDVSGGLEWDSDGAVSEDATVEYDTETKTATKGKVVSFSDGISAPIADIQLDGETSQNGTPTPSAPIPVKTVTGENVVKISDGQNEHNYEVNLGKNLFEVTASSPSVSGGVTYTKISDSSFSIASDGSASWARADIALPQPLELNTTYTFKVNFGSTNPSITSVRASFRTESAEAFISTLADGQTATLSTGNNVIALLRIYISTNTAYNATVTFSNIQLEKGSHGTSYASYFPPIELCKIGTYQDYIYKDGDTWKVHKATGKVDLSSIAWEPGYFIGTLKRSEINAIADMLYVGNNQQVGVGLTNGFKIRQCSGLSNASQLGYFAIDTDRIAFNVGTNGNTPSGSLYYALATATDTEITNQALITQLDALAEANIYNGTNYIFAVTPNEQPSLEVVYYTKYIVNITAGGYVWEEGGSGGPTTVINDSISNVAPVWTVYGPMVNPILENTTTGEEIEYVGTIADGQTLVVDMGEQTALLDGLNVIGNVTGDYVSLAPGQNTLLYSTSSGDTDSEIGWSEIVG